MRRFWKVAQRSPAQRRAPRGIGPVLTASVLVFLALAMALSTSVTDVQAGDCGAEAAEGCELLLADNKTQKRIRKKTGTTGTGDAAYPGHPAPVLGECSACHRGDPVLPDGHAPTDGMPLAHCSSCHGQAAVLPLAGVMPLGHTHALAGIGCQMCHGPDMSVTKPGTEACTTCHGALEALAEATAAVTPANPHMSPHGAPYAECALCHMQHTPSRNFCATCHEFQFVLP